MDTAIRPKPAVREKIVDELKEFAVLTTYLYVSFAALVYFKAAILQAEHIPYAHYGLAVMKAAICAKFMMIGHAMNIGDRFKNHPLILPTVYKSFAFLGLLSILTIVEEIVVGVIHGQTILQSVADLGGGSFGQTAATCFLVMLILVPYFAFRTLGELVGERNLLRLFFERRRK